MSASRYKIEIEPFSSGGGYYVNVYFLGKDGYWTKSYKLSGPTLTYWGARYKAWWIKLRIENDWFKKERTKETVYIS